MNANRIKNLLVLIRECGSQAAFAEKIGVSPGYITQLKKGERPLTEKTAMKITKALGISDGWMDQDHNSAQPSKKETDTPSAIKPTESEILLITYFRQLTAAQQDELISVAKKTQEDNQQLLDELMKRDNAFTRNTAPTRKEG